MKTCQVCGVMYEHPNPKKMTCSQKCRYSICAEKMAETNRRLASARMKARNPMRSQAIRDKVRATLVAMNHKPRTRGGNGTGPTAAQKMLADALGWEMERAIPTKIPGGFGFPTAYKVDIANAEKMVAVEVDGNSHCAIARKAQDKKKMQVLASLGWTVLRFTNRAVTEDLAGCVQTVLSTTSKSKETTTTSQAAS
jgi:hypothetical protein